MAKVLNTQNLSALVVGAHHGIIGSGDKEDLANDTTRLKALKGLKAIVQANEL